MTVRATLFGLCLALLLVACSDEPAGEPPGSDTDDQGGELDSGADGPSDLGDLGDEAEDDVADTGHIDLDAADDADTSDVDLADEPDLIDSTPPEISNLFATENPRNALSFYVDWETDEPATTSLTFDCGEVDPGTTLTSGELVTTHRVFIMGLLQRTTCRVVVESTNAAGLSATASTELTTAELPADAFPTPTVTIYDPNRLQPGWNIITLLNHFDGHTMRVALVDQLGRFRWYYRTPFPIPGADNDLRTVPGGVLVGGTPAILPQIIEWDGSLVWQGDQPMHHHIMLWPDNEHVFYIRAEGDQTCELEWKGYAILTIQNIATHEIVWEWALCQHYTPLADVQYWEHGNTLEPFPGENAFLYSPRNQNALLRIDRDTEEVEWALGFAGRAADGFNGDFEMAEDDRFYRQHAPEFQTNGNILLYDNGLAGFREESRAIEIAYDDEAMTAEVVWEYRHDPPLFSDIWGDADHLPNGNRLITFGFRSQTQGTVLVEALPDVDNTPVWVMEFPVKWGTYRTERVVDPPRAFVIPPEQ